MPSCHDSPWAATVRHPVRLMSPTPRPEAIKPAPRLLCVLQPLWVLQPLGTLALALALAILAQPRLEKHEPGQRDQPQADQRERQDLAGLGHHHGRARRASHHQ